MTTSHLSERTMAEAAAAEWWQHQPSVESRGGVPYFCGVCGTAITAPEGTSVVESLLHCADCTERVFATSPTTATGIPAGGIGPAAEQLPERPELSEAMHRDSPWAVPDHLPPATEAAPPLPPPPPPPSEMGPQPPAMAAPPPPAPPATAAAPPLRPPPASRDALPSAPAAAVTPPGVFPARAAAPPPRRRRGRLIVIGLSVVAVIALVAAAFVWAPWQAKPPGIPTDVSATAAAGSVTLNWSAATEGAEAEQYLIMRDGTQVANVPGSATTYVDDGLTPGVTYTYTVMAEANDKQSLASAATTATTTTPSPGSLRVTASTTSALGLGWSAPPNSPAPDRYVITSSSGQIVATVPGTQTSYRVTGLAPATKYTYQVVAYWGESFSGPSVSVSAATMKPPVGAARLAGYLPVKIKVIATGGGSLTKGKGWSDSWTFTPKCGSGACTTVLKGDITPPGASTHAFKVTLTRHGAVYKGSTNAHITHCGMSPDIRDVHSTLYLTIRVKSGNVVSGKWIADKWTGTLRMVSPYTSAGSYYCPAQTVTMSLTG